MMLVTIPLLLAATPVGLATRPERPTHEANCGDLCDWPTRAHPDALRQAKPCQDASSAGDLAPIRTDELLSLDDLPPCLRTTFQALAEAVTQGASERPQKAVVRARIASQFYEVSAYYQPMGREIVFLPAEIDPVIAVMQREWPDYTSPDGPLDWSGFLVIVEPDKVRVKVLSEQMRPGDVWLHSGDILGEFFPGLAVQPVLN